MQMLYRLSRVLALVYDEAVSVLQPELLLKRRDLYERSAQSASFPPASER